MLSAEIDHRIAKLLVEPGLSDLVCNGVDSTWMLRAGIWSKVANPFLSAEDLDGVARELISIGGRHVDMANPFADVAIGDSVRVHVALASGSVARTHISIRVHQGRTFGLAQLRQAAMFDQRTFESLRQILAGRQNFLISGASGSGKTTLLRAMLLEVSTERIIAIEDVAELAAIDSAAATQFISLQARQANIEGKGEIGLAQLLRESLRMRPDRIAVGEVRGEELLTMLQALNTGHKGAGATIHANAIEDVPARLLAIGHLAGASDAAIARMASAAIDWLIHISVIAGKRNVELRRLTFG